MKKSLNGREKYEMSWDNINKKPYGRRKTLYVKTLAAKRFSS